MIKTVSHRRADGQQTSRREDDQQADGQQTSNRADGRQTGGRRATERTTGRRADGQQPGGRPADGRTTNTKERILVAALRLFAERGYGATSVAEIAESVGISAPALYKHFCNKQAIFDALLEMGAKGYDEQMADLGVNFLADPEKRNSFIHASEHEQTEIVQKLFLHTLNDEMPSLFRRLMTVEQFNMPELAEQFSKRYVDAQFDAFEALIHESIEAGVMKAGNARIMAMQFASPLNVYFGVCDREPQRISEALETIAQHIHQFNDVYKVKTERIEK